MFVTFLNFLRSRAAILLTIGLVLFVETQVTFEWSLPYCNNAEDGQMFAASGLPLPYVRSGMFSAEFLFMPHVYALNIFILCLCLYPLVRYLLRWIKPSWGACLIVAGGVGLTLILAVGLAFSMCLYSGMLKPTISIGDSAYGKYVEFRPVGIRHQIGASSCTPSAYWFPDGWHGH